ncbi:MAG: hypothetical protein JXA73_00180 [Acidobacteria bacterium]|nr:hypothetical protein [Acidobacteriota bacterium]
MIGHTYSFQTDENFFGGIHPRAESWAAWNTVFKAMDGDELSPAECEIWREITALDYMPGKIRRNFLMLCGRRAGKDLTAARLAIGQAYNDDHLPYAAPGEKVFDLVISLNQRSNRVFLDYVKGFIHHSPILAQEVIHETQQEIHLRNQVVIAGYPCSHAAPRGLTVKMFIQDEAAFFRQSGVVTDVEVFRSVRPCMASIPNSRFFILSSPYVKQGLVYDLWRQYYGVENDFITVIQAPTTRMNPTISSEFLKQEQEADPEAYRREYLAEFIDSISSLFTPEAIRGCVMEGIREISPTPGIWYFGFVDAASGGPGGDSMSLGIAHNQDGQVVLDVSREVLPPFQPSAVVEEFGEILKSYRLSSVTGDRFAAGWCAEQFNQCGIAYIPSELSKSEIYREIIAPVNSGKVRLLDSRKLIQQFVSLERRVTRGSNQETIDHPRGATQHDDLANAASGCLVLASEGGSGRVGEVSIARASSGGRSGFIGGHITRFDF